MQSENKSFLVRFLRDPLSHFIIAGVLIYVGYAVISGSENNASATSKQIVVTV